MEQVRFVDIARATYLGRRLEAEPATGGGMGSSREPEVMRATGSLRATLGLEVKHTQRGWR
jgi:hypothetical protein